MTTRARVGVIAIVALTVLTSTFVYAARSERYAPMWNDVKSASTLDDPFCGPVDAFRAGRRRRNQRTDGSSGRRLVPGCRRLVLRRPRTFWMQADDLDLAVVLAEQETEMRGAGGQLRHSDVVVGAGARRIYADRARGSASKVITFEVTHGRTALRKISRKKSLKAGGRRREGVWHDGVPLVIIPKCSACNSVSHPWMGSSMEVLGVIQEAFAGYEYSCGAVSDPEKLKVILPEVLHFYPD